MNTKLNNLKPLKIVVKADHIKTLSESSAINAVSELIWNGFDASSSKIAIKYTYNDMEGLDTIIIEDHGDGIPSNDAELYFSSIGDSWKKLKKQNYKHPLHGQNGKGRFKAFSLGAHIEWQTTYQENGQLFSYSILGNQNQIEEFQTTDIKKVVNGSTGTRVIISNLHKKANELIKDKFISDLTKNFAVYLTEYPHLSIEINGKYIQPKDFQLNTKEYDLTDEFLDITPHSIKLTIVEWSMETDRKIHLCSPKGISLAESEPKNKIRAKGFYFTAYLKSEYFQELENSGTLELLELNNEVKKILDVAIAQIQTHFRNRLSEKYKGIIEEWKQQEIYPYKAKSQLTAIEKAEQEVFDILAVNVQTFLPNFDKTETTSKKFMFKLIAQAITENPESVQKIITEVLDLRKEDQDKLAELLDNTSLSSIISSASIVANRLNFLDALENLLFGKETKKIFTERDQLHKILESEAWIFNEDFALSLSEERLETVLNNHLSRLGEREDPIDKNLPVLLPDGRNGRIDLMLSKVNQPRIGEFDYLVVELKRPSKKIDDEVLTQIEKYAIAVAGDERFLNVKAKWTFLAISNELDSYATRKANQRNMPKGVVFEDGDLNITVIVKSWAEVISDARAKLQFINQHLQYEVTKDSSQKYLHETHEKYIPQLDSIS